MKKIFVDENIIVDNGLKVGKKKKGIGVWGMLNFDFLAQVTGDFDYMIYTLSNYLLSNFLSTGCNDKISSILCLYHH